MYLGSGPWHRSQEAQVVSPCSFHQDSKAPANNFGALGCLPLRDMEGSIQAMSLSAFQRQCESERR